MNPDWLLEQFPASGVRRHDPDSIRSELLTGAPGRRAACRAVHDFGDRVGHLIRPASENLVLEDGITKLLLDR
jgi:hypothetical protein